MKTLLWKDYRQNRKMLCALGIFLLMPYVIVLVGGTVELLRRPVRPDVEWTRWLQLFQGASAWSVALLAVACGCVSGNAVAGERADRSAEFAAYLPISRRSGITSKAIVAIAACVVPLLANGIVGWVTRSSEGLWFAEGRTDDQGWLWVVVAAAVLIFGVSWLLSTLMNSPAIAAASGLAAAILLIGTLAMIDYMRGVEGGITRLYPLFCMVFGISCFAAGVAYYLWRVEP